MSTLAVHIVPRLPPPPEGVGSYALALAAALRHRFSIESAFVVASPTWSPSPETAGLRATALRALEPVALQAALGEAAGPGERAVTLLHYANYGYQRRGCPSWLVEGLVRWRQGDAGRRLVTVFHEVYATGPPWRSSFWLSPLQQKLAATVARSSVALATSLDLYGRMLRPWAPHKVIAVLPVFSTVGEPDEVLPLAERPRRMAVFGSAGVRGRAYGEARPALAASCRALGIEEILDIGSPAAPPPPPELGGIPVRTLGVLPAVRVSELLLGSAAGFLAYPTTFLPKSTIFAAYCAHGVLPICAGRGRWPGGASPPCWRPEESAPDDLQGIAGRAHAWYLGHSLDRQAEAYRELLA